MSDCDHYWIPNSGRGGEPKFRSMQHTTKLLTCAKCLRCGNRNWFTEDAWNAAPKGIAKP